MALLAASFALTGAQAFELCDTEGKRTEFYERVKGFPALMKEKRFGELDAKLNALLAAQRNGTMPDALVHRAFQQFWNATSAWEPLLREWVVQFPKSQAARLALGYHYNARGWAARGIEYASKTSPQQLALMTQYFRRALVAYDEADALGTPLSLSTAQRISLAGTSRALELDPTRLYRDGIRAHPESLQIRVAYIASSAPKWGGSLERLESIAADAGSMGAADRRYIQYLVYQEIASAYRCAELSRGCGEPIPDVAKRAVEYYEKSIPLCPGLDGSLEMLMRYEVEKRDNAAAIATATRLIQRRPRLAAAYTQRGIAYGNSGKYKESFADFERATQLGDAYGFKELGWFYESGTVVPKDIRKAIDMYLIADQRNIAGARAEAERLSKSSGIPLK